MGTVPPYQKELSLYLFPLCRYNENESDCNSEHAQMFGFLIILIVLEDVII